MTNKVIKTIDQYRKIYFPKEYEKQKLSKMAPAELGEYSAKNLVIEIRKKMR